MAKRWKRQRWGKKYIDKRDWKETNEKYVKRGEFYLSLDFLDNWDYELRKMNKSKRGAPFQFPTPFILFMMIIHIMFKLPYRQEEGFLRKLSTFIPQLKVADYTTIYKRGAKLDIQIKDTIFVPSEDVVISIDSSGVKVTNRGEWMREKWRVHRGWIKVHLAVDTKKKQVVGIEVTDERVTDEEKFGGLVEQAESNLGEGKVKRALTDGAYDTKDNHDLLGEKGIEDGIKIRKNASRKARGSKYRKKAVIEFQDLGYDRWKEKHGYGHRWSAEGTLSSVKRITGEYVTSTKTGNMFREVRMKFLFYNMLINAS